MAKFVSPSAARTAGSSWRATFPLGSESRTTDLRLLTYDLLDSGDGRKLERFGRVVLARPCSQAIWKPHLLPDPPLSEQIINWIKDNVFIVVFSVLAIVLLLLSIILIIA